MFNGGGRFTGNSINVNTRCDAFYSDTAKLEVGLWNGSISIKIAPSTGVDSRGLRQYEREINRIMNVSIKMEDIETLIEAIDKELKDATKNKKVSLPAKAMRDTASKKLTTIGYDQDKGTYYLMVTADINDAGVGTEEGSIRFDFENKEYLVDYDITTGNSGSTTSTTSDWKRFVKILNGYTRTIPMEDHGVKYNNTFSRSGNGGGFGGGFNPQAGMNQGGFQGYPQGQQMPQQQPQYNAPVTTFDGSMDDLPF